MLLLRLFLLRLPTAPVRGCLLTARLTGTVIAQSARNYNPKGALGTTLTVAAVTRNSRTLGDNNVQSSASSFLQERSHALNN